MRKKFKYYCPYFPIIGMIIICFFLRDRKEGELCMEDENNKYQAFHFYFTGVMQVLSFLILGLLLSIYTI